MNNIVMTGFISTMKFKMLCLRPHRYFSITWLKAILNHANFLNLALETVQILYICRTTHRFHPRHLIEGLSLRATPFNSLNQVLSVEL